MARASGGRRTGNFASVPKDNPEATGQVLPMFTASKGIDRFHASSRVDPQLAVKIRNLMFDDSVLVSRLGTEFMGGEAASPVLQIADFVRKGRKKVTIRFCTRHIEIFQYGLNAWRSIPVPFTGSEADFYAFTGWADKLLFSNGVNGLWEFDFGTQVVKQVPGGPSAKHLTTFGNRVVASSTVENGQDYPVRVRWTAKNDYKRWAESTTEAPLTADLAGGYEDLYGSPGGVTDEAMGVFPFSDEQAWLVRSRSTWQMAVSGNVLAPFRFNRIHPHIGTTFRNSIVSIESGVVFLSREDVYHVHVGGYERIGQAVIDEIIDESSTLNVAYAAYDVSRQEYRLAVENLVWRYRFLEQGWTADEYPWDIRSLSRQVQGIAGLPIDSLIGIIDELSLNYPRYPRTTIDSLVDDRSFDDAMMFVPVVPNVVPLVVMVEIDNYQDKLVTGELTDSEIVLETGVLTLNALKAVELHAVHGEYESGMTQTLRFDVSFSDGVSWLPYSFKNIEATEGSEMFMCKSERVSRKIRLRMCSNILGRLRLLGLAPILVLVERSMATRKPKPASIVVVPNPLNLVVGGTQQLSWQVLNSGGQPIDGVAVAFLSSNSAIATVSGTGLVRAIAPGSFTIVATCRNVKTNVPGTVTAAEQAAVAFVIVTPETSVGAEGTTQQFTATLQDAAGNILVGRSVVWASSVPGFATVSPSGLATLISEGTAAISATSEGVVGAASLTVVAVAASVSTVEVLPANFTGGVGDTLQLTAIPRDVDGNILSGLTTSWVSSNTGVATVNSSGLVSMVAAGDVTITATIEGISDISSGSILAPPATVASVTVTPTSFSIFPGQSQALTVIVKDSLGNVLTGRTVSFVSSNVGIATVDGAGLVTGVAVGNATITVTCEGKSAVSSATVAQTPVASVTVAPSSFVVNVGSSITLTATPRDASGNPLTGRTITWGSSDVTKATVSNAGVVTAIAQGSVVITATSETKFGTSSGTVSNVAATPSPLDSPSTVVYIPRPAVWALPQVLLDSRYNRGGTALVWASDVTLTDTGNAATNTTNLQAEIDAAAARTGHSRIKLPNGWVCNRIRLRKHAAGIFWTYIEAVTKPSSEGVRPQTSAMANAPQIRSTTATETGAVWCDLGADYTRFVGIRFLATTGSPCYRLLYFQGTPNYSTENADTSPADLPQWMIVDRCWVDGGNVSRNVNGIAANTREFACVDSVIDGIYYTGIENHGIVSYNGLGPMKMVGNFIEAGSISVLIGGSDPRIPGLQTSDIEVRRNHMYKRPSWNLRDTTVWDGVSKVVKNIFELKWGDRVLIEGNVFENSYYGDNQLGAFLVFKVENSLGGNTTVLTENITYRFNRGKNVAGGYEFQGVGVSAGPVGAPLRKVQCQHNVVEGLAPDTYVHETGTTRAMFLNNAAADIIVDHDTFCLHQGIVTNKFRQPILFAGTTDEVRLRIDNSLLMIPIASPPNASNSRVIFGDGSQVVSPDNALTTLSVYAPGYSFLNNVLVKSAGLLNSGFPPTSRYTDTIASVKCVSPSTGNFALASDSPYKGICSDGSDPGANMSLVNTATAGVVSTVTPTCTIVTSTSSIPNSTFPKPGYLTPVIEPDFKTLITRITGDPGTPIGSLGVNWPTTAYHNYAKDQVFSADMGLIALKQLRPTNPFGAGWTLFLDGNSYQPVVARGLGGERRWHPTIPDVMIQILSNGTVNHVNVRTNVTTQKVAPNAAYSNSTFGPNEGNTSYNGKWVVIQSTRISDGHLVARVIDIDTPANGPVIDLTALLTGNLDWVSMSAGGGYVVAQGAWVGTDTRRMRVWNATTGLLVQSFDSPILGHADLGIDQNGNEVVVSVATPPQAPYSSHVIMRQLNNGLITDLSGAWFPDNWHASTRCYNRPGWAVIGISNAAGFLLDREVVGIKLSASNQIERYGRARTETNAGSIYDAHTFACPSPDGKRIVISSNWLNTSGPIQTYVIDVRNICP